jgi:hypothetical protein
MLPREKRLESLTDLGWQAQILGNHVSYRLALLSKVKTAFGLFTRSLFLSVGALLLFEQWGF